MGNEILPSDYTGAVDGVADGIVRTRHLDALAPVDARDSDVRLTLPARPENVAVIRHVLGAFAEALRLPDDLVEDMRLAVTEACTNVVRHAYADGPARPGRDRRSARRTSGERRRRRPRARHRPEPGHARVPASACR